MDDVSVGLADRAEAAVIFSSVINLFFFINKTAFCGKKLLCTSLMQQG